MTMKNNKGLVGISIAIIGAIVMVAVIMTVLIPILFLKINVSRTVEIEYDYDNAGLAMLTLLSDEGMYRNLSMYVAGLPDNPGIGFFRHQVEESVKLRLMDLVSSQCFELYYGGGTIASIDCNPVYGISADISLPYGLSSESIQLEIK